jgi:hypothetical protein
MDEPINQSRSNELDKAEKDDNQTTAEEEKKSRVDESEREEEEGCGGTESAYGRDEQY